MHQKCGIHYVRMRARAYIHRVRMAHWQFVASKDSVGQKAHRLSAWSRFM